MKKIIILCTLLICFGLIGCGSIANSKAKPSDDELEKATTIYGVVREINNETIRIQLCTNVLRNYVGAGYISVDNEYGSFKEGDNVLLYYTGTLKCEIKDTYAELCDMDVCYMEKCENDGQFVAKVAFDGGMLPPDATHSSTVVCLTPIDGYCDGQFSVNLLTEDLKTGERIETDIYYEIEDSGKLATVIYDIQTMEVISIIQ